uniref:Uncharacterized protein n=1 Tax=Anopheles atroparvus TaxID=41427 RepID=A0AAG5DQC5_ANOAO
MVKLILIFCTSNIDVCVMAGTSLASIMLLHLCKAMHHMKQALQRPAALFRDHQEHDLLEKIHRNVDNICIVMLTNIRPGFKFTEISVLLTDHVCEMLDSFPYLLIEKYNQLNLLDDILSLKNKKAVQSVLKYLRNHFSNSICSTITTEVSLYIISREKTFLRGMDNFKSFESSIIQLLYHACSDTGKKLSDETCERIAIRMFSTDETTVNAAIELISLHYTGNAQVGDAEADTLELENYSFNGKTIVHIITYCHHLLMADIKARISPSQEGSNSACWATIKMRIESFVI